MAAQFHRDAPIPLTMAESILSKYPQKVLVAWGEAISGNREIRQWLIKNGFPELGIFVFALHLKADARKWLLEHGHAPLMALISGIEGDGKALDWLEAHDFPVLRHMAVAGGDEDAMRWLIAQEQRTMAVLALKMWSVKMAIEDVHNDPYKFSQD
jgi:hypothetical protein